jgi:GTP-binding protein
LKIISAEFITSAAAGASTRGSTGSRQGRVPAGASGRASRSTGPEPVRPPGPPLDGSSTFDRQLRAALGGADAPHIAMAGRSNVGKSTLINALCRKKIARTSAAPGKTRLANVYRVVLQGAAGPGVTTLHLVDLPGYGYARGGADAAEELRLVAEAYFTGGPRRAALLLVDARHPGLASDIQAARWLDALGVERHIVATKIDKLTRAARGANLRIIAETFGTAALPVSAERGEGLDELWRTIVSIARGAGTGG